MRELNPELGPSAGKKHHQCKCCVAHVRLGRYFFKHVYLEKTSTRGCRWCRQGGTQRVQIRNICTHLCSRRLTQRLNPRLKAELGCDVDERMQRLIVIHLEQSWVPLGPLTFYSWSVYTPDISVLQSQMWNRKPDLTSGSVRILLSLLPGLGWTSSWKAVVFP